MKHVTLSLVLLLSFAFQTYAAYWVVDTDVPVKGRIVSELTEQEKILLTSYRYVELSDSVIKTKDIKKCSAKYNRLVTRLQAYDQRNSERLLATSTVSGRDTLIAQLKKEAELCLKKEGASISGGGSDLSIKSGEYIMLEKRIVNLELQIKEIVQALKARCILKDSSIKGCV